MDLRHASRCVEMSTPIADHLADLDKVISQPDESFAMRSSFCVVSHSMRCSMASPTTGAISLHDPVPAQIDFFWCELCHRRSHLTRTRSATADGSKSGLE